MSKSLWSQMGVNPKTSFYYSNGTGRDSYIMHDNGGTVKAKSNYGYPQPSRYIKTSNGPRSYKPQSDNKVVHYISDGSGRDNYILVNSGGLTNYTYSSNLKFLRGLREDTTPQFDQIQKAKLYNPDLNRRQRLWSAQNSRPKRISVPFEQQLEEVTRKRLSTLQSLHNF
ncbi:hypothetical protein ABPG73_002308 [Tetrahymena malaccensis]